MQTIVKKFDELTNKELYEILQMRSKIFVVEQNCPYLDADGVDLNSYHVMLKDGEELAAIGNASPINGTHAITSATVPYFLT